MSCGTGCGCGTGGGSGWKGAAIIAVIIAAAAGAAWWKLVRNAEPTPAEATTPAPQAETPANPGNP